MSSWVDRIKNPMVITTGDGVSYTIFAWLNARKQIGYNIAEFEFPNVDGTLVRRGRPLGRRFDLEIYFQGENNIEDAHTFEVSAADSRPWTINHPYYDIIYVHPTGLLQDNSEHNVTKFSGLVIETILETIPFANVDPVYSITLAKQNLDLLYTGALTVTPTSTDVNKTLASNKLNYHLSVPIITLPKEFEAFNYAFNQAQNLFNSAVATPSVAMAAVIGFLSKPALFTVNVTSKLNALTGQFNNLRAGLSGLTSVSSKQLYQNMAGSTISSMCLGVINPLASDYGNSMRVLYVIDSVTAAYNQYLTDLDALQGPNGGNPINFIPDADSIIALDNLFTLTVANLYNIALNGKQERVFYCDKDTNPILLTHRFYGLDPDDANIEEFINDNNLSLDELTLIKKGRKIVYYI